MPTAAAAATPAMRFNITVRFDRLSDRRKEPVLRPCQGFLRVKAVLFVGLGHEVYHSVFVGFHAITFLYSDSRYFNKLSDRKVSTGSVTGLFSFAGDAFEEICHRASLDRL